jgi:hypothetical protein
MRCYRTSYDISLVTRFHNDRMRDLASAVMLGKISKLILHTGSLQDTGEDAVYTSPAGNDQDSRDHQDGSQKDSRSDGFHTSKEERAEKHSEEWGGVEEWDDN